MALMELKFYAQTLGMCTSCYVILPQRSHGVGVDGSNVTADRYPVLYLLHGASDDHTIWLRRTNIERYVSAMGWAVVMPEVLLSRYENMAHGPRYQDFIVDELPQVVERFFPISGKREDKAICGLSMGGWGALKAGLMFPDKYAHVGILSSGNLLYRTDGVRGPASSRGEGRYPLSMAIYNTMDQASLRDSLWDPYTHALTNLKEGKIMPRFFHAIGVDDFLYEPSWKTKEWFEAHPEISYEYHEGPGAHTWDFWDQWIQVFLKFMVDQDTTIPGEKEAIAAHQAELAAKAEEAAPEDTAALAAKEKELQESKERDRENRLRRIHGRVIPGQKH
ncbi:MAG: esterase family protein [Lachnospiraceae bacterium]|nr:esterase family protein [Lachnospiraceae bacterium]